MSRSKSQSKQPRVDDLFTKIESEPIEMDSDLSETTVLFVGDSGCGKTTLINSFLKANSSKQPKPTYALDYAFARKKAASSSSGPGKTVAHIWELGGDIKEPGLLDVPISARSIKTLSIVICLDLSKPHNILMSLRQWIKLVREVISRKTAEHNSIHPNAPFEMDEARIAQYAAHPDERVVSLSKVPVYIAATKYDIFKDIGSVERRAASQILRFVCHYYGATLITTSAMDAGLRENFKTFINGVCFRTGIKQYQDVHHERPLHVTAGKDTFDGILLGSRAPDGSSSGPESQQPSKSGKSRLANSEADIASFVSGNGLTKECWNRLSEHLRDTFECGPDDSIRIKKTRDDDDGPGGDSSEHPEPEIDEMRSQRDVILKRYIQEMERKEAMQARMAAQSSSTSSSAPSSTASSSHEEKPTPASESASTSKNRRQEAPAASSSGGAADLDDEYAFDSKSSVGDSRRSRK